MKKRFNEQQIIAILKEAEAGIPTENFAARMESQMQRFTNGAMPG